MGFKKDGCSELILLDSDIPVAVQVKRRLERKTESVSAIREFLGAALLRGHRRLIYATTARSYSDEAKTAAQQAVALSLVESYELINIEALKAMAPSSNENVWRSALSTMEKRGNDILLVPDPYQLTAEKQAW